ncbi:MAG: TetR family transcriptional regulator [Myxococcota bacterium]
MTSTLPTGATRSERTKEALARAAVELFAERGYEETTIDDIVERAGVSRRTFFRHFPSKADPAMHHWDLWLEALKTGLAERTNSESVFESIAAVLKDSVSVFLAPGEFVLENMKVIKRTPALRRHPRAFLDRYTRVLARFIKGRLPDRPAVLSEIMAAAIMAAVMHAQWEWVESDGTHDLAENFRASFEILTTSFAHHVPGADAIPVANGESPTVIVISPNQSQDAALIQKLKGVFGRE